MMKVDILLNSIINIEKRENAGGKGRQLEFEFRFWSSLTILVRDTLLSHSATD
jgi:hypothetical protein